MNLGFGIKHHNDFQKHRGFALVTALSLMAFMLVLVVTLLSLMEVETRSADNNLELQKAREGARLALSMAVSQLQEHAGNDQRITARADITGATSTGATYWTGVWDTSDASEDPKWLVSGTAPVPTTTLGDNNSLILVGDGSLVNDTPVSGDNVRAPVLNVFDKNGNISSRVAWWVSDEGVKVSASQLPLNRRITGGSNPSFTTNSSLDALYTSISTSAGLEELFLNYNRFKPNDAPKIDLIDNIQQLVSQSGFEKNLAGGWDFEYTNQDDIVVVEDPFHTLTSISYGLLASTAATTPNGLMRDLSQFPSSVGLDPGFSSYINRGFTAAQAKSGLARKSEAAMRRTVAISPGSIDVDDDESIDALATGTVLNNASPILTNFMLAFAVFESSSSGNSLYKVHFFSEFWNPYTSTLDMSNNGVNYDLELEIRGLPTVAIDVNDGSVSEDVNLHNLLGDPLVIRLEFPRATVTPFEPLEAWHPGMTKNWSGIAVNPSGLGFISDETESKVWNADALTHGGASGISTGVASISSSATDTFRVTSKGALTQLGVKVFLVNAADSTDRALISEIRNLEYSPAIVTPDLTSSPFLVDVDTDYSFGFHFRLKEPKDSNGEGAFFRGLWLVENDPRNPLSISKYATTSDGLTISSNPNWSSLAMGNPNSDITDNALERPQRLFNRRGNDNSVNDHLRLWQESPLFELPRERILSLASLQHLYFHNERPFKIGNSWGDSGATDTLAWFDQFFFSGIGPSDILSNFTQFNGFPNPNLITYEYQGDPTIYNDNSRSVAQNAMVAGRFNLNSTSVSAWEAVLGGLRINNWNYLDYYPENDSSDLRIYPDTDPLFPLLDPNNTSDDPEIVSRGNMFTRFPSTAHETYDVFPTPGDFTTTAPSEYYRRGVRYLTSQQVEDMAKEIVAQIKERFQTVGIPFFTVKDFLNNPNNTTGSVLEEAIAASVFTNAAGDRQQWDPSWEIDINVDSVTDRIDIDYLSPGFLTQADIMTAIGPMLAPRSDTFKIRARCQTLSPFDSTDVIGDATIEAVVQRVPDKLNDGDNINNSIDRKFKIMSVRWLTEDEI